MSDVSYLAALSQLEHLTLLLLTAAPPPEDRWKVLERVMNSILRHDTVHAQDIIELKEYLTECIEAAKPLLSEETRPAEVTLGSPEMQAFVNMHVTQTVLSLNKMRFEDNPRELVKHLGVTCMTLHSVSEIMTPFLRKIVAEWFENVRNRDKK